MKRILHITSRTAWLEARAKGEYAAPSLASEGFIHCSTAAQVLPVAGKFYRGQTGLVLLVIDPARLASDLRWEAPFDGAPPPGVPSINSPFVPRTPAARRCETAGQAPAEDAFPHIYGPLNLEAVVQVIDFEPATDGRFVLPALV